MGTYEYSIERMSTKDTVLRTIEGALIYYALYFLTNVNIYEYLGFDNYTLLRNIFPLSIEQSILMIITIFCSVKVKRKCERFETVFSVLCAVVIVGAYSVKNTSHFFEIFDAKNTNGLKKSFFFLLLLYAVVQMVELLLCIIHKIVISNIFNKMVEKFNENSDYRQKSFKRYMILFLVVFVPWFAVCIIRYPAGVEYDANLQIAYFLSGEIHNAHYPPFSSAAMGAIVRMGISLFSSAEAGYFLLSIVQSLFAAGVFTYSAHVLDKLKVSNFFICAFTTIYVISPTFYLWGTSICKDIFYTEAVFLFTVMMTDYLLIAREHSKEVGLVVLGILIMLLRKNGVYIFYGYLVALGVAFTMKKKVVRLSVIVIIPIMASIIYNSIILPALNIQPGSVREAMAIPFQQTARYVEKFEDEVTDTEKAQIDEVLSYDKLIENYNPAISDPIKDLYKEDKYALAEYLGGVWLEQGLKHPLTYMDATFLNCYQFFYPNSVQWTLSRNSFFGFDLVKSINGEVIPECYFSKAKRILGVYGIIAESLPIVGMIYNTAVLFWAIIYCILACFNNFIQSRGKDSAKLFILIPSIIGILVCVASPCFVNNGNRYGLPIAWSAYFLLAICLGGIENGNENR